MNPSAHILIIDDEASLRQTLARVLQRASFEVTTAESGKEALSYIDRQQFELVFLDIRMPDMNGLEVLKAIHSNHPEIPVILFTAQPDLNSAVEALRQGASDYLLKPLKPQELIKRTKSILEKQEKERRKREIQSQVHALQSELRMLEGEGMAQSLTDLKEDIKSNERFITCGKLTLDLLTRHLLIGEQVVNLPPATFDYLLVLVRHAPNVVDYQTMVAEAQGYQAEFREAQELVKWHVHHIRQVLEPNIRIPSYLINVRGIGYRLVSD